VHTVYDFLEDYIQAAWQLELLLTLRSCDEPMTASALAGKLYMSQEAIQVALTCFVASDLVRIADRETTPTYVYRPSTAALRHAVDLTANLYRERRASVVDMIYTHSRPNSSTEYHQSNHLL